MNELDLYKFCQNKEMQWHAEQLLIYIDFCDLKEFAELIGGKRLDDGGIEVTMLSYYIGLDLVQICEYWGIKPERIYSKVKD